MAIRHGETLYSKVSCTRRFSCDIIGVNVCMSATGVLDRWLDFGTLLSLFL